MNELKATCGPWSVGTKVKTMVFASDGLDLVADCTAGEFTRDVEVANAALIAAAPELCAALKKIAEYPIEDFGKERHSLDTPLFGANGWLLTIGDVLGARAALKKARGES